MQFLSKLCAISLISSGLLVAYTPSACTQELQAQQKFVGLHHLSSSDATSSPTPPEIDKETGKESEALADSARVSLPVYKPLTVKELLVKPEDLEKWDHLDEAALAQSNDDLRKLVYLIESDRGAVPPQGLFLTAKALSDQHMMELSAVYYFLGQLRLNFDMARWPPQNNPDDVKRLAEDAKKTPDQAAPNRNITPRVTDPHHGIEVLADSIGQPIIAWTVKDQSRIHAVIARVREWDASAPYAYQTGYDVGPAVPFETWGKLLEKNRDDYFSYLQRMMKAMERVRY